MCHYLLPEDTGKGRAATRNDTRYADNAMRSLVRSIKKAGTCAQDYQVGLFGGGNMFTSLEKSWSVDVGSRNIAAGYQLVRECGFTVAYEDLGGKLHRQIILDLVDGTLHLRRGTERTLVFPAL